MFRDWPISHIRACESLRDCSCKSWLLAMADTHAVESRLPDLRWLHDTYKWGPSRWPVTWSDLINAQTIDCGVFADLTQLCFSYLGIESARVQSVVHVKKSQTEHWRKLWSKAGLDSSNWILDDNNVYHELLAVVSRDRTHIYDSTDGHVVEHHVSTIDYRYMRLCEHLSKPVFYGTDALRLGEWTAITL